MKFGFFSTSAVVSKAAFFPRKERPEGADCVRDCIVGAAGRVGYPHSCFDEGGCWLGWDGSRQVAECAPEHVPGGGPGGRRVGLPSGRRYCSARRPAAHINCESVLAKDEALQQNCGFDYADL